MPAAAVIPAPIAYIKVVAVKKLVVGSRGEASLVRRESASTGPALAPVLPCSVEPPKGRERVGIMLGPGPFTLKKLECSKRADFAVEYVSMG